MAGRLKHKWSVLTKIAECFKGFVRSAALRCISSHFVNVVYSIKGLPNLPYVKGGSLPAIFQNFAIFESNSCSVS